MLQLMSEESAFVSAFVVPERRGRYVGLLRNRRGRDKFRGELAHFRHFDPRFIASIPAHQQSPRAIEALLRRLGATERCFVFSESGEFDGESDLGSALDKVVGQGLGTVLSCLPGVLAYYEGEEPGERFVLRRS
jgi:hypothetical protein